MSESLKRDPAIDPIEQERDAQPERSSVMFNPWLTSSLKTVQATAENILFNYESLAPRKQRRMKARDRENLATMLHTVVANLAWAAAKEIDPATIGISLRTSKQKVTRYDRPGFSGLPNVLRVFAENLGRISLQRSSRKGIASQITLAPIEMEFWRPFTFRSEDFSEVIEARETICLSRTERDYVDGSVTRELIHYEDSHESRRYREEMARINAYLAKSDLRMESDTGPLTATSIRHLRRHFKLPPENDDRSPRFDLGGRLFGGWWQELPRERRHAIRIGGEPIADLDFASMFLRLAYLEAGIPPPEGDLYAAIPGFSDPRWRDGVKKVVSAMLFRDSPMTRLPRGLTGELPPYLRATTVRSAIRKAHPALAQVLESGIGLHLMFVESQILVAALLRLVDLGIPALPMHDGLMVPRSKATTAAGEMLEASLRVTGFRLPISLKSF
jgi:hypothetical protein